MEQYDDQLRTGKQLAIPGAETSVSEKDTILYALSWDMALSRPILKSYALYMKKACGQSQAWQRRYATRVSGSAILEPA